MIGCIIQARTGSTRLPWKVMQKIDNNSTVLDYVINQVKSSKRIKKIIVATTNLTEDDVICEYLASQKIEFFRGSSEDVLDRYYQCAKKFTIDNIVRITADNPLIDPDIIDLVIDDYKNKILDILKANGHDDHFVKSCKKLFHEADILPQLNNIVIDDEEEQEILNEHSRIKRT